MAARQTDLHTCHQNRKSLYGGLHWAQSGITPSQRPIALSRLCPRQWFQLWEPWAEHIFQGQGRDKEPPMAQVQIMDQPAAMSSDDQLTHPHM